MTKNVLITGSSSGIGAEVARKLAEQDYVSGIGLHFHENKEGALKVRKDISHHKKRVEIFQSNFESGEVDLVKRFIDKFGSIDILVNSAGVVSSVNFEDLTFEEYEKVMNVNSRAAFFVSRDAFVLMKKKGGKIINISSFTAKLGFGRNRSIQYAASKAALDVLSLGLAKMGAPYNILVNSVSPGMIETRIHDGRPDLEERKKLIPLGKLGSTKDVANMVEYLASEKGDFITGQVICISGGE
jgi:NAD(P)-dependent dehydrogenase (short-subunit alcohol dehydrogenase family)